MNASNIYYSKRVQPLKGLYNKIKLICESHIGIAQYQTGELQSFSSEDVSFPLVYMETIQDVNEEEGKFSETYSIALNVLDMLPANQTEDDRIEGFDKCKQILDELKSYFELKNVFGNKNVSTSSYLLFSDFDDASLVRVRAEFRLTVEKQINNQPDLNLIFSKNG